MVTQKISKNVCLTTGGGRFVDIPGFPGERIDRRLLPDLRFLEQRYKIFVTDGLSEDPVHAANGEHPIGLAADIVPNTAAGGTWNDIDRLAHFAEPTQNQPRSPFRWVGYDGDSGHGRGNHLHLSWNHSETKPGVPAASVYTLRCPGAPRKSGGGNNTGGQGGNTGGNGGQQGGGQNGGSGGNTGGGIPTGGVKPGYEGGNNHTGGFPAQRIARQMAKQASHPVVESGGVDWEHR
jgi:hypothetical protein